MTSDMFSNRIDRRTVIKTAALAGVAQIASPFVVTSWAADNVKIGLDNPLTGTFAARRQERVDRLPARGRADQRQGRHSRPQGRSAGRGFDQRRRRHRGAESQQADRARQGRLPARQRQLGAGAGDGQCHASRRACSTSFPAATPIPSPARSAIGTCSASATRRAWKPIRCRRRCSRTTARSGTSSPPTTHSAIALQAGFEASLKQGSAAAKVGGDSRRSARPISPPT